MLSVVIFLVSAAAVILASTQLSKYGDVIAVKTGLGRLFIGTVLLAAATSLPELLTNIISVRQELPNLAAGNLLGSCIFNMVIIAGLDIGYRNRRIMRRIAMTHTLTASLGIAMLGLAVLFILARLDAGLWWFGWDSLALFLLFLGGLYIVRRQGRVSGAIVDPEAEEVTESLGKAILIFALAAAVLFVSAIYLVNSSSAVAELLGVGTGFFGTSALAIVTSLPEVTASIAAVRMGAYDLAIGNLFGSNMFNIMTLAVVDAFHTQGFLLSDINESLALAGLIALLLTAIALIGNLARVERRIFFVEIDALVIIVTYVLGMLLLLSKGVALG